MGVVVLAAAILGGTAGTYLYDRRAPLLVRLAAGSCTGLAAVALAGFLLAWLLGVTPTMVALATFVGVAPAAVFGIERYRLQLARELADSYALGQRCFQQAPLHTIGGLALAVVGSVALWRLMDGAMIVRPDGIYTLDRHNFGDLPFHLAAITRFAANANLPPEHPSFAGLPFTYPFLSDFLSAMLVTAGVTLRSAVVLPGLLGSFALVVLLYRWTLELTDDRRAACLAPALVLVGGGLGWWIFVREAIAHTGNLLTFLAHLPHDYTIREHPWRWGNVITSLFVPQRGLQLALPLAVVVFRQWWLADRNAASSDAYRRMCGAGVVAGLLPLMHGHTYLVVMGVAAWLVWLVGPWRAWVCFFIPAIVVGAPQVLWLSSSGAVTATSFVGLAVGWDHADWNAVVFWIANTGVFIPLIVCAVLWRATGRALVSSRLRRYYLPFALCFLIPNVVRLAPWVWDNIKVLVYWWVASAPLVGVLLSHWSRNRGWQRALAVAAFVSLTFAGALDLWRALSGAAMAQVLDRPAVAFADVVADVTEPESTIVHAPVHNHPLVLTGRRSLMGYPGHLWTHGIDYTKREQEIRRLFAGDRDAEALVERYQIDYAVVGPDERRFGPVNDAFFSRYPVAGELGDYRLYRVRASGE